MVPGKPFLGDGVSSPAACTQAATSKRLISSSATSERSCSLGASSVTGRFFYFKGDTPLNRAFPPKIWAVETIANCQKVHISCPPNSQFLVCSHQMFEGWCCWGQSSIIPRWYHGPFRNIWNGSNKLSQLMGSGRGLGSSTHQNVIFVGLGDFLRFLA